MNWRGIWHLGTRYLRQQRAKTALLVAAFTLVWLLPTVVGLVVSEAEKHLRSRANETPLIMGRTGSHLELVFNGLYFSRPDLATFPIKELAEARGGLSFIPIYARFASQGDRIVGTTVDYFDFRRLSFDSGRGFIRMGECVVGSKVAKKNGLAVGDSIISSPGSIFDIAGVYPLKMTVCGILKPRGTPDDSAIFVDLKTTWIIEGLGHGHEDADSLDENSRLETEEDNIRLNASVKNFREITVENATDFHFHGDPGDFPITSALAIPENAKAQALFKDRFQTRSDMQVVSPAKEMDELFDTVFQIQKVVTGILIVIGLATLAIGFLVFSLSYRLRIREFTHLSNMGADPSMIRWLIAFEAVFVLIASLLLAGVILAILKGVVPVMVGPVLG